MSINPNERQKKCPQCGTFFACCIEKCWCSELPQIMEISEKGDCFCPNCLKAIIQEKIDQAEARMQQ